MRTRNDTNLQSSLADHMHQVHKLGKSNKDSCYYRFWQNIKPLVDPALSNAFFTSASYQVKRTRGFHKSQYSLVKSYLSTREGGFDADSARMGEL